MAGAGYRDWVAGDVPTATQFDTYLQEQTVMVFADAAARDAALVTAKAEGMVVFLKDVDRFEAYTGAAWVRIGWTSSTGRTGCTISRSAAQSIPNNTTTAISWDTEVVDSDGFIVVTSTTVTIPAGLGGLYSITPRIVWASSPSATSAMSITAGGITHALPTSNTITDTMGFNLTMPLSAADTILFQVRQTTGGAINATAAMFVYRVGL